MAKPSKTAPKEPQCPYTCGFCETGIGWRVVTATGRTRCPGSMPYASAGKAIVCACAESGHDTGPCGEAKARQAVEEATRWTPGQLEAVIHAALKDRDFQGVEAALRLLALEDPHRAREILDTLNLAVSLRDGAVEPAGTP